MNTGLSTSASSEIKSSKRKSSHIYKTKSERLTVQSLPHCTEWWNALADQYPGVNLHAELLKAMDWHRADQVKSPKLFFRNWVERASLSAPQRDLTAEEVRARLRIVS